MKNIAKRNRTQNSQTMQFFCLLPNEMKSTHAAGSRTQLDWGGKSSITDLQISQIWAKYLKDF